MLFFITSIIYCYFFYNKIYYPCEDGFLPKIDRNMYCFNRQYSWAFVYAFFIYVSHV